MEQLRQEMVGDKAKRVLETIFAEDGVTAALGMTDQLREIRSIDPVSKLGRTPRGALPQGLIKKLKKGLGDHIKTHFYNYVLPSHRKRGHKHNKNPRTVRPAGGRCELRDHGVLRRRGQLGDYATPWTQRR